MFPLVRSRSRSRFFGTASTLNFNFVDGSPFPGQITFTRASGATRFNSSGVLETVSNDVPRLDFNPATLAAQGLLIEEQRTNSIRNNTMQGAVAGTPGTAPTNWSRSASPTSGISSEIVGTGTETGITYIDIRFSGTCTGAVSFSVVFETSSGVAASPSQAWTASAYVKLQAGSLNGSTFQYVLNEYSSVPAFLRNTFSSVVTPTSSGLATQRTSATVTTGASTAFVQPVIAPAFANGLTYDFTLRIGLPQLELGAFATSVIPTTTTALTRSADVASVNTLTPWFNAAQGTTYFEGTTFDTLAGAFPLAYQFNDGTNSNRIQITRNNGTGSARMAVIVSGAPQAAADATAWTLSAVTKAALSYATNDFTIVANGGAVTTDTLGTVPSVNRLNLGGEPSGGSPLNGHIRRIVYYSRAFAGAQLQQITA